MPEVVLTIYTFLTNNYHEVEIVILILQIRRPMLLNYSSNLIKVTELIIKGLWNLNLSVYVIIEVN